MIAGASLHRASPDTKAKAPKAALGRDASDFLSSAESGPSRSLLPWFIQTKLRVDAPSDPLEQKADQTAQEILSGEAHGSVSPTAGSDEQSVDSSSAQPTCATPTITDASETSWEETETNPTLRRLSIESDTVIRRQTASSTSTTPRAVVAPTLTWADFPAVPTRRGGHSANTAFRYTYRNDGTRFNMSFNRAGSWAVVADETPALLRHEQYHLNLVALIANKANAASGTMPAAKLIGAFKAAVAGYTKTYDDDTEHSQNTELQQAWENDIDAGIVQFPGSF